MKRENVFRFSLLFCTILLFTTIAISQVTKSNKSNTEDRYVCLPCGNDCDKTVYTHAGKCQQCHMQLVKQLSIVFKSIRPDQVCNYVAAHKNVILLDVRTKEEFEGTEDNYGRLKNAINIPIQDLESRIGELSKAKNKEIIVYCSHSHRSPQASYLLTQKGFTNVTNVSGGMSVWKDYAKNSSCLVE